MFQKFNLIKETNQPELHPDRPSDVTHNKLMSLGNFHDFSYIKAF